MKEYDVVVIGAGSGATIAFQALGAGYRTALVAAGPAGGTCVNTGCLPSKTLIRAADRVMEIAEARRLGIGARAGRIDFPGIMEYMRNSIAEGRDALAKALSEEPNLDWYRAEAHFTAPRTLRAGGEAIRGERVFIASGARPLIPPIEGIGAVSYLTNETLLELTELPSSLAIIGGGYVGVEYAHFFAAMGTAVSLLQRNPRLVTGEEPEISALLARELGERMNVRTDRECIEFRNSPSGPVACSRGAGGEREECTAARILLAAGRRSNADTLDPAAAGVETDAEGWIKVDGHLRTTAEGTWAVGDAVGRAQFTHAADAMARLAWHNATHPGGEKSFDFSIVPHAVFTRPEIASIGMTEEAARKGHEVLVGRAPYADTVMGGAMRDEGHFAKAVVEKGSGRILGFHIIGPEASILLQEVVQVMAAGGTARDITGTMHTFPSLSEVVPTALDRLK